MSINGNSPCPQRQTIEYLRLTPKGYTLLKHSNRQPTCFFRKGLKDWYHKMRWFKDLYDRNVRLTDERLEHFENDHPEMAGQIDKVGETLLQPEIVVRSKTDSEAELFYRHYLMTPIGEKYMCVVVKVKVDDVFILTAYFTDTIKKGDVLWEKQ
jgi:hypothetical protein